MTRSDLTHAAATAALELLPDGVLVVCDGEVLLANRALCRLAGDDLVGGPAPQWLRQGEVEVNGRRRFLDVTASMGICDIATAGDGDALLRRADEALYWAKAFGRDAALVWSPATAARIERARDGDHDDADHGRRVAAIAIALAEARGWHPAAQARLYRAALVHDIGKVALPDAILNRPGPLTTAELEHVRQHARIGAALAALDPEQEAWIRHHHERWDGSGYLFAVAADEIPEGAQLLAIADAWDTMTSGRPYRAPLMPEAALAEVDHSAGTHLRPDAGTLLRRALGWLRGPR